MFSFTTRYRFHPLRAGYARVPRITARILPLAARMVPQGARPYNVPPEEAQRSKYDRLLAQQMQSTIESATIQRQRRPWRTVLVAMVAVLSFAMATYVAVQLYVQDPVDGHKSVFVPLWVDPNWRRRTQYAFPRDVAYLDPAYAEHLRRQWARDGSLLDQYLQELHVNSAHYCVLEQLTALAAVRRIFGVPLEVLAATPLNFTISLQPKYPTVSGVRVDLTVPPRGSTGSTTVDGVHWSVRPVNFDAIISDALVLTGLKLDRLDSTDAALKTHERASGRVHEVLPDGADKLSSVKDYDVIFSGDFAVHLKNMKVNGTAHYTAVIDFDHLVINRGVKIVGLVLACGGENYKVV